MAHDEELAARLRALLAGEPGLREARLFGGIAFLVDGHLAVAASGQGGLMVRVDPADTASLVDGEGVTRMEMRGRAMDGWLRVTADVVADDDELARWAAYGLTSVRMLPPKGS